MVIWPRRAFVLTGEILTELIIDGEWIETTPEHPFYVEGKGWTEAGDLRMGDQIRQADGMTGAVWLKWEVHKTQEMYNLTVDTAHTFYVGEGQWLVHNACPIYGTLQKGTTPAHNAKVWDVAKKFADSGDFEEVWIDKSVKIATRGKIPYDGEPDVLGLNFTNKFAHIVEVPSPSQISKNGYTKWFLISIERARNAFTQKGWKALSTIVKP